KILTRRAVDRVSNGHRIHFVLGAGAESGLLLAGDGLLPGKVLSKDGRSKNLTGKLGPAGGGAFMLMGSTTCGVTSTSNSLLLRLTLRERNRLPSTGMSPMPGILLN